jgi:hypothetical protein
MLMLLKVKLDEEEFVFLITNEGHVLGQVLAQSRKVIT